VVERRPETAHQLLERALVVVPEDDVLESGNSIWNFALAVEHRNDESVLA
jgi:hypothetical protein